MKLPAAEPGVAGISLVFRYPACACWKRTEETAKSMSQKTVREKSASPGPGIQWSRAHLPGVVAWTHGVGQQRPVWSMLFPLSHTMRSDPARLFQADSTEREAAGARAGANDE